MTLRKADFTVTADTNGNGFADVTLRPSVNSRSARLERVTFRRINVDDQSVTTYAFGNPTITLSEVTDVSNTALYPWNTTAETRQLGRQVFHVDTRDGGATAAPYQEWVVREPAISPLGATPTTDVLVQAPAIRADILRCEVFGASSGDVIRVTAYYETAGDYRF